LCTSEDDCLAFYDSPGVPTQSILDVDAVHSFNGESHQFSVNYWKVKQRLARGEKKFDDIYSSEQMRFDWERLIRYLYTSSPVFFMKLEESCSRKYTVAELLEKNIILTVDFKYTETTKAMIHLNFDTAGGEVYKYSVEVMDPKRAWRGAVSNEALRNRVADGTNQPIDLGQMKVDPQNLANEVDDIRPTISSSAIASHI